MSHLGDAGGAHWCLYCVAVEQPTGDAETLDKSTLDALADQLGQYGAVRG